jgi:hypothetical protein
MKLSYYSPTPTLRQLYEWLPQMYEERIAEEKNEKVKRWLIASLRQITKMPEQHQPVGQKTKKTMQRYNVNS